MKEEFIPFTKNDNENEQSGDEENGSGKDSRENFVPFDEETNSENSGDVASFARRRLK